jgi:WD40 repeat protein
VVVSPDGKRIAAANLLGEIVLWERSSGKVLRVIHGNGQRLLALRFSDGSKEIEAIDDGRTVVGWRVESGAMLRSWMRASRGERGVLAAFRPDGKALAILDDQRILHVWTNEGTERRHTDWHVADERLSDLAWSPDGRLTVLVGAGPVKVWTPRFPDDEPISGGPARGLVDRSQSLDGERVALGIVPGTRERETDPITSEVELRDWSGRVLLTLDRVARQVSTQEWSNWRKRVALSADGKRLAVADIVRITNVIRETITPALPDVRIYDDAGRLLATLPRAGEEFVFSPDGTRLATLADPRPGEAWRGGVVRLWDVASGQMLAAYQQTSERGKRLLFSPDGRRLLLLGGRTAVLAVGANELRLERIFDEASRDGILSPDSRLLATTDWPGNVSLWEVETGRLVRRLGEQRSSGHSGPGSGYLAFSPDGSRLAYVTDSGTVRLHDMEAGQDVLVLRHDFSDVPQVFFTKDGSRLVAQSGERQRTWDTAPLPPAVAHDRLARARIRELFSRYALCDEVRARLRADPDLSEEARAFALSLVEPLRDDADRLNSAAWMWARFPNGRPEDALLAIRQAETACKIAPAAEQANCHNTLGAVLYRAGKYEAALAALYRARELRPAGERDRVYDDLAFLALVCHRLGRADEARDYRARLLRVRADGKVLEENPDLNALVQEVEETLGRGE